MVKNVVDVIFGGLTYWMFGYGLSFGDVEPYSNPFCGWGSFFVTASQDDLGWVYAQFFFQASFATTATTIVSGKYKHYRHNKHNQRQYLVEQNTGTDGPLR